MKLFVSARVILTDNISVSDRLINGSTGTVQHLGMRSKPLLSTTYMKFDNPKTGDSMKDKRFFDKLKKYMLINARTKKFPITKGRNAVIAERKQFWLTLGHASMICKSQGSTLAYM